MRCDDCCYSRNPGNYSIECHAHANYVPIIHYGSLEAGYIDSRCKYYCTRQKELFSFIDD